MSHGTCPACSDRFRPTAGLLLHVSPERRERECPACGARLLWDTTSELKIWLPALGVLILGGFGLGAVLEGRGWEFPVALLLIAAAFLTAALLRGRYGRWTLLDRAEEEASDERALPFAWPPPGLEGLQGTAWTLAGGLTALFLPIFLVVLFLLVEGLTLPWDTLVFLLLAFFIVIYLLMPLAGFSIPQTDRYGGSALNALKQAVDAGYSRTVLAEVLADERRDGGDLLAGTGDYRGLPVDARRRLRRLRMAEAGLAVLASIWWGVGMGLGLLLSLRGHLGPGAMIALVLVPGTVCLAASFVIGLHQSSRLQALRRGRSEGRDRELRASRASAWSRGVEGALGPDAPVPDPPLDPRLPTLTRWVWMVVLLGVIVWPLSVFLGSAIVEPSVQDDTYALQPVLAPHVHLFEGLREYRPASSSGISPEAAGEALYALGRAGTSGTGSPWPPNLAQGAALGLPLDNPEGLFRLVAGGIGADQRRFLDEVAAHPAFSHLDLLGRAARIDLLGTRFDLEPMQPWALINAPGGSFPGLAGAPPAVTIRAAAELSRDRALEAEEILRSFISVGFLLLDDGPLPQDNVLGATLILRGASVLEGFFRTQGQNEEADGLRWTLDALEGRATATVRLPRSAAELLEIAADSTAPRGLRWRSFHAAALWSSCSSPRAVLFGLSPETRRGLELARERLARSPVEDKWLVRVAAGPPSWREPPSGREAVVEWLLSAGSYRNRCTAGTMAQLEGSL